MNLCVVLFPEFPMRVLTALRHYVDQRSDWVCALRTADGGAVRADDGTSVAPDQADWAGGADHGMVMLLAGPDWPPHMTLGLRRLLFEADHANAVLAGLGHGAEILVRLEHLPRARLACARPMLAHRRLTAHPSVPVDEVLALCTPTDTPQDYSDPVLDRARGLMQTHLTSPLPIPALAKKLGLSAKQFRTRCVKLSGDTPARLYQDLRLKEARQMITQTAMPIAEIAGATGFSDASAFTRAYRARFGHAPRRDRQACTRV